MTLLIFLKSMLVVGTGVILAMLFWAAILPVIADLQQQQPPPPLPATANISTNAALLKLIEKAHGDTCKLPMKLRPYPILCLPEDTDSINHTFRQITN